MNGPLGAKAVTFGEVFAGAIEVGAEMDAYSFAATAGDVVQIRMSRAAGVDPQIERFDGVGNRLGESSTFGSEAQLSVKLESAGGFFVLASDRDGDETGAYTIVIDRIAP